MTPPVQRSPCTIPKLPIGPFLRQKAHLVLTAAPLRPVGREGLLPQAAQQVSTPKQAVPSPLFISSGPYCRPLILLLILVGHRQPLGLLLGLTTPLNTQKAREVVLLRPQMMVLSRTPLIPWHGLLAARSARLLVGLARGMVAGTPHMFYLVTERWGSRLSLLERLELTSTPTLTWVTSVPSRTARSFPLARPMAVSPFVTGTFASGRAATLLWAPGAQPVGLHMNVLSSLPGPPLLPSHRGKPLGQLLLPVLAIILGAMPVKVQTAAPPVSVGLPNMLAGTSIPAAPVDGVTHGENIPAPSDLRQLLPLLKKNRQSRPTCPLPLLPVTVEWAMIRRGSTPR